VVSRWTPQTGTVVTKSGILNDNVWVDLDVSGAFLTRYVRPEGLDALAAREDNHGLVAWYLTDHLGSVRALTDNAGVVQDTIQYAAFGAIMVETNRAFGGTFKFTAGSQDSDTGFVYHWKRYEDTLTGTWTTQDPILFGAGDPNPRRYLRNSPTNGTDPTGLQANLPPDTSTGLDLNLSAIDPQIMRQLAENNLAERYGGAYVIPVPQLRPKLVAVPVTGTEVIESGTRMRPRQYLSHYKVVGNAPETFSSSALADLAYNDQQRLSGLNGLDGLLTFSLHLVPFGTAADKLATNEGTWGDVVVATIGDAGTALTWGGSKLIANGLNSAAKGVSAVRTIRTGVGLSVTGLAVQGGVLAFRGNQLVDALGNGDWRRAAGLSGEIVLRLVSVGVGARQLVPVIKARLPVPKALRYPKKADIPEGNRASFKGPSADVPGNWEPIPAQEQSSLGQYIEDRNAGALRRADAKSAGDAAAANIAQNEMNQASSQLGVDGAKSLMGKHFPDAELKYQGTRASGKDTSDLDLVYKQGETYFVVEGKGGTSNNMGVRPRQVENGEWAEQGTQTYLKYVLNLMDKPGHPGEQIARDLNKALDAGKVRYLKAETPIHIKDGNPLLDVYRLREFNLTPTGAP
jgi:RHS repeat-associated protein